MSDPGPGEHRVGDDVPDQPDADNSARASAAPTPGGPAVVWLGRRPPSHQARLAIAGLAVLLAGYLSFTVGAADWAQHPWVAALGVVCGVGALGFLVAGGWARRPQQTSVPGPSLRELPEPTRDALLRELRAGRPGPPELRPYAVAWTCQNLQGPWAQTPLLAVAAGNAGISADGPIGPITLSLVVLVPVLWAVTVVGWARRRRAAARVADALDQLTPPPPRVPVGGDVS